MPGTATPIYPQTVRAAAVQFIAADTTTVKTILTGGANGTQVSAINVSSTDATTRSLKLHLNDGTSNFLLSTNSIAGNSGNTTVLPVDLLRSTTVAGLPYDAMGNRVIFVPSGWSLRANLDVATTATINVVVTAAGDY